MKKCDACNENPANVHITQILDGQTAARHLCEECARKNGITISISHENFLAPDLKPEEEVPEVACPTCSLPFSEFRSKGWLGCSDCYSAFEGDIDELLVQMHGSMKHRGKRPGLVENDSPETSHAEISRLEVQLDQAVQDEEFELAAAIRDVLRTLKSRSERLQGLKG